jgi:hypothetical protein
MNGFRIYGEQLYFDDLWRRRERENAHYSIGTL